MNKDRPWNEYPLGTKALAIGGGHWYKTPRGWKWNGPEGTGSTFPTPGADVESVVMPNGIDAREMNFWIAEYNGSRYWKTARGSSPACWAALCDDYESDPLELQSMGWRVLRCVGKAIDSDSRYKIFEEEKTCHENSQSGLSSFDVQTETPDSSVS